jgi:hypothetical protein
MVLELGIMMVAVKDYFEVLYQHLSAENEKTHKKLHWRLLVSQAGFEQGPSPVKGLRIS